MHLLPTTVVGSFPQPNWLIDRDVLSGSVPRIRRKELWRIPDQFLEAAQDDATIIAIRDMEPASTSSPTARCAAKAIRTGSRQRSRASTPRRPP
jgi:hypothetical protein